MEKILLVEDDISLGQGLEYALAKEGYGVQWVKTVRETLGFMRTENYNLILLDVMLPDGNGFDLCNTIRQTSRTPIIFLTACDEEVNIVMGLDLGADDYITKPFRVRELLSRIKAALRRSDPGLVSDNAIISSQGFTLISAETRILKDGVLLDLTPAEYKLLALFLRHPGQILTRELILEKLWDAAGEFVDDNTLSVYIRRLREKIESDPSRPECIVTVRGAGYRWNQRSC